MKKSEEIKTLERIISRIKAENLKRGTELRLHSLSELFSLTPFETDVLLIGLAPELADALQSYTPTCKMA